MFETNTEPFNVNEPTVELFGNFFEQEFNPEQLSLVFSPYSIPFSQRWQNNSLSANFLAQYVSTFFPQDNNAESYKRIVEIKSSTSFIINELLENAMKYCHYSSQYKIITYVQVESNKIRIYVSNVSSYATAKNLEDFIQEVLTSNSEELYINQIEKNAEDEHTKTSGLGLLTLINDYSAQIGWKFENMTQEILPVITITTMVEITV